MNAQLNDLATTLRIALGSDTDIHKIPNGSIRISVPIYFDDGDSVSVYVSSLPSGAFQLSDMGATMMHLSYMVDVDAFFDSSRHPDVHAQLAHAGLEFSNGEIRRAMSHENIAASVNEFAVSVLQFHNGLARP